MKTIGEIIREKRKERGWTLEELAEKISMDFSSVGAYELNKRTPPLFIMCDLADIFECSLDELCGRKQICSSRQQTT